MAYEATKPEADQSRRYRRLFSSSEDQCACRRQ
jgi:hypothetical protein